MEGAKANLLLGELRAEAHLEIVYREIPDGISRLGKEFCIVVHVDAGPVGRAGDVAFLSPREWDLKNEMMAHLLGFRSYKILKRFDVEETSTHQERVTWQRLLWPADVPGQAGNVENATASGKGSFRPEVYAIKGAIENGRRTRNGLCRLTGAYLPVIICTDSLSAVTNIAPGSGANGAKSYSELDEVIPSFRPKEFSFCFILDSADIADPLTKQVPANKLKLLQRLMEGFWSVNEQQVIHPSTCRETR